MTWYTAAPRDPLMVRDGRPFGLDTDGARSLDFPPPSVLAGMVRTRIGFADRLDQFQLSVEQALAIEVSGPLLARVGAEGKVEGALFPAPRDCVLFEALGGWRRHRLRPEEAPGANALTSLPGHLLPVAPDRALPANKPASGPAFWTAAALRRWLEEPGESAELLETQQTRPALTHERRVHVAIDPDTLTAEDGKLFQTDGLRFERWTNGGPIERMCLLLRCKNDKLRPGLATLGGERRLTLLEESGFDPTWPAPTLSTRRARVVLLTPALFDEGGVPGAIAGARVVAAAVGRPLTISGWDMAIGGPKRTRRLAPAGSVYWVELPDGVAQEDWCASVHFGAVSDQLQDRRDGFGLAAVGVWA